MEPVTQINCEAMQRGPVHCEICDEDGHGTTVNIHPIFCICDDCLMDLDLKLAAEVIGGD
mgnify:CR=1 FL=1